MNIKLINSNIESLKPLNYNNEPLILLVRDTGKQTCDIYEIDKNEKENGKSMINSHFFINKKGLIYVGRPEKACTEFNNEISDSKTILVDLEGDFSKEDLSTVQGNSLLKLARYLKEKYTYLDDHIYLLKELYSKYDTPGVMFPINNINALYKEKSTNYVYVNDKYVFYEGNNPNTIYTYKSRDLMLKNPKMIGNDIRILKVKLNQLNIDTGGINDIFDIPTEQGVNNLRKILKKPMNGIANKELLDDLDHLLNSRFNSQTDSATYLRLLELKIPFMQGEDVIRIQKSLYFLGLYEGKINGLYNYETVNAVRKFQYMNGIDVDGKIGPATWSKITEINYVKYTRPFILKEPPLEGDDIKQLQMRLIELGYSLEITGKYDYKTFQIVCQFQREKGLNIDGIVTESIFNLIFKI